MEEQNQNWKDVIYEQDPEEEDKPKKGRSKRCRNDMKLVIGAASGGSASFCRQSAGSFYQIQEQEQAVLVTFGKAKSRDRNRDFT